MTSPHPSSQPMVYEINARCWLTELSSKLGRSTTLHDVPKTEIESWRRLGFTHIWLMGVWRTGAEARNLALQDQRLLTFHRSQFSQLSPEETIGGSPYAISDYSVPHELGGTEGLVQFRQQLHDAQLRLILDFVPNHVALDHWWTRSRPELFVSAQTPTSGYFPVDLPGSLSPQRIWLAHGRDPYFPPWPDVAQLDYRKEITQETMSEELLRISDLCDGVRCDMAMLVLNDIFAETWCHNPTPDRGTTREFWSEVIPRAKERHPDFLMLAEAYWDYEIRLQELGFDYTYDKKMYDFLVRRDIGSCLERVRNRASGALPHDAHFLENHDEPRIATIMSWAQHRAAALVTLTLPGLRLIYEGQLTGAGSQTPVQMKRRPEERPSHETVEFYTSLLELLKTVSPSSADLEFLDVLTGESSTHFSDSMIAYSWKTADAKLNLVSVNYSGQSRTGFLPWARLASAATNPDFHILFSTRTSSLPQILSAENGATWKAEPWEACLIQFEGQA